MTRLALFLGLAGAAAAQQGTVAGPTSGMVFDRTAGALRPILGVPGAATFGGGIALGYPVNWIAVAPRVDSAVAAAQDGSLHFLRLTAGGVAELPVAGVSGIPKQVVYSPSGSAAALISAAQAQVVTGLPGSPVLTGNVFRLEQRERVNPGSVALSDDGTVMLVANRGSVSLAGGNAVAAGMIVAFAPGSHDAAIADGAGVSLVRSVDSGAQATVLAATGVSQPVGLAFSTDGATVYAAGAAGVVALPAAGGAASQVACSCQPAEIAAMGSLFRLNDPGQGPLWLLDPTGQAPRTVFVPALQ